MTIWRMRVACWITKATNTHSEYVILIAFPLQQWFTRTSLNVTLHVNWLYCYSVHTFVKNERKIFRVLLFVRKKPQQKPLLLLLVLWRKVFVCTVLTKLCPAKWILTSFVRDATTDPSRRTRCRPNELSGCTELTASQPVQNTPLVSALYITPLRSTILRVTKFTSTPACRQKV